MTISQQLDIEHLEKIYQETKDQTGEMLYIGVSNYVQYILESSSATYILGKINDTYSKNNDKQTEHDYWNKLFLIYKAVNADPEPPKKLQDINCDGIVDYLMRQEMKKKLGRPYDHQIGDINPVSSTFIKDDEINSALKYINTFIHKNRNEFASSNQNDYCWINGHTFSMRMNNNQQVIIDFETKQGTSAMYIVFKHLFSKWQSTAEDNIFIEKTKLDDLFRNQLRKDPTENTVKSTISNIRKRIRDKNLQNNVEITYDKKKQGYNFRIHNPFRSS